MEAPRRAAAQQGPNMASRDGRPAEGRTGQPQAPFASPPRLLLPDGPDFLTCRAHEAPWQCGPTRRRGCTQACTLACMVLRRIYSTPRTLHILQREQIEIVI